MNPAALNSFNYKMTMTANEAKAAADKIICVAIYLSGLRGVIATTGRKITSKREEGWWSAPLRSLRGVQFSRIHKWPSGRVSKGSFRWRRRQRRTLERLIAFGWLVGEGPLPESRPIRHRTDVANGLCRHSTSQNMRAKGGTFTSLWERGIAIGGDTL